ncbi:hypothetical protein HJG60_009689 [Phyllostomus discolor]|uniref:Uncharacterized protein n=1 Tax=Phyllostomus discolor TaxID=89673 RepID=A0A834B332_9CHIR|nr:hypothetical protein HJG60_009689 [Phyllostomus discolor]
MLLHTFKGGRGNGGDHIESFKSMDPKFFSANSSSFSFPKPSCSSGLILRASSSKRPSGVFSDSISCDCSCVDRVLSLPNCLQFSEFITVHCPTSILLSRLYPLPRACVSVFLSWLTPTHVQNSI